MICPHGEIHPSCCMDCLADPPPETSAAPLPVAERWIRAKFVGRCASDPAHVIDRGDPCGLVDGLWLCEACAR